MESKSCYPKIVITGMGVISSLGKDVDTFWANLLAGKSGIGNVTRFDTEGIACKVGAEVTDFDPAEYMDPREARRRDLYTQYAVAASGLAVKDAALDLETVDPDRFGVIIGSGIGGMETIGDQTFRLYGGGPRKVSPFMIPMLISNMASGIVAIEYGARGPNYGIVSACATGSHAIGDAVRMLRLGEADIMLVGGSEAAITQLSYAGFSNMKAMSSNFNDAPETSSRPFDKDRDGFVMAEGAGVLVVETLEHAKARGARIYCEIIGHAATCDAHHITAPHPEGLGLTKCLQQAMKDAGISPEEVDYINAHGTSTPYNDKGETLAVKNVFGAHAYKLKMSSTKSMTGHLLGAAGAVEAIACAKSLQTGKIAPTINYTTPDPDCDLDCVPNKAIDCDINIAISNNLGFGGHNASIVFRKYTEA
ncbi:MAG: beta-ketoacyl-ACP synthase II [Opitutales bacterium]|nr:beta-ketoacyl-ACP synthase II [Opitutales bacterium]